MLRKNVLTKFGCFSKAYYHTLHLDLKFRGASVASTSYDGGEFPFTDIEFIPTSVEIDGLKGQFRKGQVYC
jgi:hypothetical protein